MAIETIREPARETPVVSEVDVLVVGGGTAGVAAAVAAARAGAKVALAERYGSLGGLATGGLIVLLLTLDDGRGRQVIAGLCQELTERLTRAVVLCRRQAAISPSVAPAIASLEANVCRKVCHVTSSRRAFRTAG